MTAGPFGPGSFRATVDFSDQMGGRDLWAYAHSTVTGQESVISVPITIGQDVNQAFVTPPTSGTMMCIGCPTGTNETGVTSTTAPGTTTTQPTTSTSGATSTQNMVLEQGGMFLGTGSVLANNLWSATIDIPKNQTGLHNLTFYARSSVGGGEISVTVPVTVAP